MDPNKALKLMVEAFARGERDEGLDALDGLRDWLMSGGFVPTEAAIELLGENPRIRVMSQDVPDGTDFCKLTGSTWYRRISQSAVDHYLEEEIKEGAVYGVTDYGNMTDVAPKTEVWVHPPLDWKQCEEWCELMTKYTGYDPDERG